MAARGGTRDLQAAVSQQQGQAYRQRDDRQQGETPAGWAVAPAHQHCAQARVPVCVTSLEDR
jgi:hypothetical protein